VHRRGSPLLQLRLDLVTLQGLRAYAVAQGITKSELVRQIISAWVRDRVGVRHRGGGVSDTLQRIDACIYELEINLYTIPVASNVPKGQKVDVQLNREKLLHIALNLLQEAATLSENEELAAKAKARLQAMQMATQTAYAAECILRDYQRDEILKLVQELVKTNEHLKKELRELKERAGEAPSANPGN